MKEDIQKRQQKIFDQQLQFEEKDKKKVQLIIKQHQINKEYKQINLYNEQLSSNQLRYLLSKQLNFINTSFVQQISLSKNQIDDDGIKQFCSQLIQWTQLNRLGLDTNLISMKGVFYLSKAAQMKRIPQLKSLTLQRNKIGSFINKQFFNQAEEGLILKFANQNTKLQYLSLRQNQIKDEDMKILFQTSQINGKNKKIFHYLKQLSLGTNKLKDKGFKIMTHEIIQYPSLKLLYLFNNQINKNGIKNLISYKTNNTFKSVKCIWLQQNELIRDEGIFNFLKGCLQGSFPQLQKLSIWKTNMSNIGIEHIMKLYHPSKILKLLSKIDITENKLLINKKLIERKFYKKFDSKVVEFKIY